MPTGCRTVAVFFPFVKPQPGGSHTGVRRMALPYRIGGHVGRSHPYGMPKTDCTVLNADMVAAGLIKTFSTAE